MRLQSKKEEKYLSEIEELKIAVEDLEEEANEPGDDADDTIWLVSYADLMTLIACFFILMMAFANYDPSGFKRKSAEVAKHFSGKNLAQAESAIDQLMKELQGHPDISEKAKIALSDEGVKVIFKSNHLFEPFEADLKDDAERTLDLLIDLVYQKNPDYRIMIEGHSDNLDPRRKSNYRNNWELSSARASSVVTRFQKYGFSKESLVAIGYGDSRPVAPNQDAKGDDILENQVLNRRVIIKVLEPMQNKESRKLGLGVYFTESELFPEQ